MEDYEAQERSSGASSQETDMSRSQMLKRSFAAAAGLTVLASPGSRARRAARGAATPPLKGKSIRSRSSSSRPRRKATQHDCAAARLGELRRDHVDVLEEVRHPDRRTTTRTAARRRRTRPSARSRATRVHLTSSTSAPRSRSPGRRGSVREVLHRRLLDDPALDEGHARLLVRRLLGRDLDRLQPEPRHEPAEDVEGPAEAGVQGQGRAERLAAHVGLGGRRRLRRCDRQRRLDEGRRSRASTSSRS